MAPELRTFLPPRSRGDGGIEVLLHPGTPLAHLVPAAGVPLVPWRPPAPDGGTRPARVVAVL